MSHGAKTSVIAKKTNKQQWLLPSNIVKKPSQGCLGLQNLLHPTFLESIIHQLQRTVAAAMITFGWVVDAMWDWGSWDAMGKFTIMLCNVKAYAICTSWPWHFYIFHLCKFNVFSGSQKRQWTMPMMEALARIQPPIIYPPLVTEYRLSKEV